MGFLDKMKQKLASMGPDIGAVIEEGLDKQGDTHLAHAMVISSAFENSGSDTILRATVNSVAGAVSKAKHISGAEGSIAQSLPRTASTLGLAISGYGISVWDFGTGYDVPETPLYRVAREHITSITDTGQRAQGGGSVWRFAFNDDSFYDYRVYSPSEGWAAAVAGIGH